MLMACGVLRDEQTMTPVGLLYQAGDVFAERRMDLLAGPMLLAGVRLVRFTSHEIVSGAPCVDGEWYLGGAWQACKGVKPRSILDLTPPKLPRSPGEASLLESVPHTRRIDSDRFELLAALQADPEFAGHVAPGRVIEQFDDVVAAEREWGALVIKSRADDKNVTPCMVERTATGWRLPR